MAKRAPAGEAAYDPLDQTLVQSVIRPALLAQDARHLGIDDAGRRREGGLRHGSYSAAENGENAMVSRHRIPTNRHAALGIRGLVKTKRVLLTPDEERHIERLVDRIAEQVGASLKLSHVLRACMALLCHAKAELLRHAGGKALVRPANGDAVALAQFEQEIARVLSRALRDAPPIR